jgi:pimeloyl-ACP methyl ester carboxylesterase
MATKFATAEDGTRIAYDVTGQGPALMLLHGAGKTRRDWHKVGYVDRLKDDFTVITEVLLLLHGGYACFDMWIHQIVESEKDYRVIAPTCPVLPDAKMKEYSGA